MTEKTSFLSGDSFCAAWLTLPTGSGPFPTIVLVHGGGATHDMKLEQYETAFSERGFAVLSFDFRHLGESGGEPRQLMSISRYLEDIEAAIHFAKNHPQLDASQVALWGTSFGASHALVASARHPELKAVVVQCPMLRGRSPALASGLTSVLRLTFPILSDIGRQVFGLPRKYVALVGNPGDPAFVTVPGALAGWQSVMPEGYRFDNRITAASGISTLFYDASKYARDVQCPLLVCISDRETLMDPAIAVQVARDAKFGKAIHYEADHFQVYHSPVFDQMIEDQISFFAKNFEPANSLAVSR
ncbi:MAG: alpha/beta fold hydrolase [Spirochaetia bacterium]|nr:alpha/beta fold hydrolase [Spirochaetia bacterium]